MKRWYLVHTQPRREFLAGEHLERQGFCVFLPWVWRTVRHARRLSEARTPLFPGYLFAGFDPETARWRSIDGTTGVVRLVKAGGLPQPAPMGLVETLHSACDEDGAFVRGLEALSAGQRVRILDGPFAGELADILELRSADRIRILLSLMESQVRLEVPAGKVSIIPQK
ncbi:MAG: transcription termination/antitermination protein NusG [Caulobacterales bacterium]|uniref:transcription termination/antitermination protein NusG n=1 Tax=Glycocaulis sp. TaxID=1969725 RepID=UPI003FA102E3